MEVSTLNLHFPDGWSGIIENGVFNWWIGVGKFHSTFQVTERGEDSSPDSLVNHFKSLGHIHWKEEKSGAIQYITDNGERYSLILNYKDDEGLSISYNRFSRGDRICNFSMIAYEGDAVDRGFELLENGVTVPVSFLSLEAAWPIIREFIEEPTTRPASASWIDSQSLDWPEDY